VALPPRPPRSRRVRRRPRAAGDKKIGVIKVVREIVSGLGLKEAKDLVDSAPKPLLEKVTKDAADEARTKLETAGATVTVK